MAHVVGGQKARDIHIDLKQIANGVGVFGAIEAVERGVARIGMERGFAIDGRFERRREGIHHGGLGTRHTRRRHETDAHLLDHLLGQVAVLGDVNEIEFRQRHAAGLGLVVMAIAAILIEESALGGFGSEGRLRVGLGVGKDCKEVQRRAYR